MWRRPKSRFRGRREGGRTSETLFGKPRNPYLFSARGKTRIRVFGIASPFQLVVVATAALLPLGSSPMRSAGADVLY